MGTDCLEFILCCVNILDLVFVYSICCEYLCNAIQICSICRFFTIDTNNGNIRTSQALDFERQQVHYLMVTARDGGASSRSTNLNVTVLVRDVEDVLPVFPERTINVKVPENEQNYVIARLVVC